MSSEEEFVDAVETLSPMAGRKSGKEGFDYDTSSDVSGGPSLGISTGTGDGGRGGGGGSDGGNGGNAEAGGPPATATTTATATAAAMTPTSQSEEVAEGGGETGEDSGEDGPLAAPTSPPTDSGPTGDSSAATESATANHPNTTTSVDENNSNNNSDNASGGSSSSSGDAGNGPVVDGGGSGGGGGGASDGRAAEADGTADGGNASGDGSSEAASGAATTTATKLAPPKLNVGGGTGGGSGTGGEGSSGSGGGGDSGGQSGGGDAVTSGAQPKKDEPTVELEAEEIAKLERLAARNSLSPPRTPIEFVADGIRREGYTRSVPHASPADSLMESLGHSPGRLLLREEGGAAPEPLIIEDGELIVKDLDNNTTVKASEIEQGVNPAELAGLTRVASSGEPTDSASGGGGKGGGGSGGDAGDGGSGSGTGKKKKKWFSFGGSKDKGGDGDEASAEAETRAKPVNFVPSVIHKKNEAEFVCLFRVQELAGHEGPVWTMRFSCDERFLATGGQDSVVRVWAAFDTVEGFMPSEDAASDYGSGGAGGGAGKAPAAGQSDSDDDGGGGDGGEPAPAAATTTSTATEQATPTATTATTAVTGADGDGAGAADGRGAAATNGGSGTGGESGGGGSQTGSDDGTGQSGSPASLAPGKSAVRSTSTRSLRTQSDAGAGIALEETIFHSKPYRVYRGHTSDVLEVAWSKSNFLLSSSRDKTVRLWHVTREDVLAIFRHHDMVTTVAFHPLEDELFVTGSFDKRMRLWNIRKQEVEVVIDTPTFITAVAFARDGSRVFCGLFDGQMLIYSLGNKKSRVALDRLTTVYVRSARGKNAKAHKITGIEASPDGEHVLVTSNDSRIRLYNIADYSLTCKYKGGINESTRIKASFSEKAAYIVIGSESNAVYMYKTVNDYQQALNPTIFGGGRQDRSESYEYFIAHDDVALCSLFAPHALAGLPEDHSDGAVGQLIVSVSYDGAIRVYRNFSQAEAAAHLSL